MDDLIDIKTRFIAPTVIHCSIRVFKMIIMDDEGDSNSALTTLNDLNSQESPRDPSKIPKDKSIKTGT